MTTIHISAASHQGHPDIQGVWAGNDSEAMGVIAALKSKGKVPGKDVLVSAMDLNPENVDAVKSGEQLYDIGGYWIEGGVGLVIMARLLLAGRNGPLRTLDVLRRA